MGAFYGTAEIVELEQGSEFQSSKSQKRLNVEDDINRLFESIRITAKTKGVPQVLRDKHKKSMKRPMRVGPFQSSGTGFSEPVSLKQALRGLTVFQASEIAAMKRSSKPQEPIKRSQIASSVSSKTLVTEFGHTRNLKLKLSSLSTRSRKKLPVVDEITPAPVLKKQSLITEVKKTPNKGDKGEFSQSSNSVGECSSSTSFSCDSYVTVSRSWCRPHMSKDLRWEAVNSVEKQYGSLNIRNFKLIKKIGNGDIGTVYLAELIGSKCFFALKISDNEFLGVRKKAIRAQTEREILQLLDHPFLPTLFSQFSTDKHSCLVTEYCPGGDLHVLRQKQPNKCFSEQAARFYVAEILLALEYLHMLGVVYRDLKPENILIREDGHIMLTDFDLSLRCDQIPTLVKPSSPSTNQQPKNTNSICIDPFCLQPSWQVPCFKPNLKSDPVHQTSPLPQLVVEPTGARSNSFVGTHEYLAPEIIKGEGHGSPVDWWTFGILLYELLYGDTPFKGVGDDDILANIVSRDLKLPDIPIVSGHTRDLIKSLLQKKPENRLGSLKGAAEIKNHSFFAGLNWALIRCATPPEMPKIVDVIGPKSSEREFMFDMF